jgi:hypothetical protein
MLFALRVIPLAVLFRGGAVGLGGVFMMFGCFIVFVSGHLHSSGECWGDGLTICDKIAAASGGLFGCRLSSVSHLRQLSVASLNARGVGK